MKLSAADCTGRRYLSDKRNPDIGTALTRKHYRSYVCVAVYDAVFVSLHWSWFDILRIKFKL